jgi:hypothetical protein
VCSLSYPACEAPAPYYIVICGLFGCTVFFTLSHKRYDFRGKEVIEHEMCVLFSNELLPETFIMLRRIQRVVINVRMSLCKVPVVNVGF